MMKSGSPKYGFFLKKGEYLFHQGDPTQVPFIIRTGTVCLFKNEKNSESDLEPTETIAVFDSLARRNFIKQKYSKITVFQRDTIELKTLKVLCV